MSRTIDPADARVIRAAIEDILYSHGLLWTTARWPDDPTSDIRLVARQARVLYAEHELPAVVEMLKRLEGQCAELRSTSLNRLLQVVSQHSSVIGQGAMVLGIDATPFFQWVGRLQNAVAEACLHSGVAPTQIFKAAHETWPAAHAVLAQLAHCVTSAVTPPTKSSAGTTVQLPKKQPRGRGVPKAEANVALRNWYLANRKNRDATSRQAAKAIGCSEGLVCQLSAWKAEQDRRCKRRTPKQPRAVSFTRELQDSTGVQDETLELLKADQEADDRNFKVHPRA